MNKLVLKFNSGGQGPKGQVLLLQEFLKSKGINPGKLDNIWGKNTERAVKEAVDKGLLSPESLKSRAIVAPTVEQNVNTVQNMYTKSSDLDTNLAFKNYRKTKKIVDEAPAKAEQARKAEEQKNAKLIKRKGVVRANAEKDTKAMQEALLAKGYDLGKWGADGKWGNASQAAYDKAIADGWIYSDGKLVKKPKERLSTSTIQYTTHPMFGISTVVNTPSKKEGSNTSNAVGDIINRVYNVTQVPRRWVENKIRELGVSSGNEIIRGGAQIITLPGMVQDAFQARINNKINEVFPGYIGEKAQDQIGKGHPVWTVDKEFGIARYYDGEGNLKISSPVGTGLVRGAKQAEGDNKTPTGTYTLASPEKGSDKKGGEMDFGPYFYRTDHRNNGSKSLSGVGLHGTGTSFLNGSNVSHGCMRIDNDDIQEFYKTAPNRGAGTKIIISD